MNIQVRVLSARAQSQVAALQAQVAALQRQLVAAGGSKGQGAFAASTVASERALIRMGNQLQWTGRQLEHNFTLPLALAGAAATKFELDNQKAMTAVAKVYGDGTQSAQVMRNELDALGKAFEALSERFGVNQAEVINVAAGWAAAGASGIALAKATEITLRTMVLGGLDATKATEALISIQAQYGLSTKELSDVIAQLNIIENQTGVSLAGLVEGYQRAAGVARSAGVDTRHLGAMIAAMSPAAGSAAQAGNALKTIISRLLAPTKEATEVMGLMGVNTADLAWKSLNATQRLELMSKKFNNLDDAQKAVVSATIASRYQINKFDVLMREMSSTTGFYNKALDATSDRTRYLRVAQQELNQVLNSSPKKFQIIWTIIQNAMADVIQPLIPLMLSVANAVRIAVQWFSNLNPSVQKLILAFAVLLALIGPIARYLGAVSTLFGVLHLWTTQLGGALAATTRFLVPLITAPFSMVASGISSIAGALVIFTRQMVLAALFSLRFIQTWTVGAVVGFFRSLPAMFIQLGVGVFMFGLRMLSVVPMIRIVFATLMSGVARALIVTALFSNIPRTLGAAFVAVRALIAGFIPFLVRAGTLMVTALGGPWGLVALAILGVLYSLRDRIGGWVQDVVKYFYMLPDGVVGALEATVNVIASAAKQIYEWFQYINPFARHSPSLVDNVKNGMKVIKDEFGRLKVVSAPLDAAKVKLAQLKRELQAQQGVVNNYKKALDAAEKTIDAAKDKLQALQDVASRIGDSLNDAKDKLSQLASTPIQGMKAMEDQIFATDMAQKKLQLQLMKMEDAMGPAEDLSQKLQNLQGQIELVSGKRADLRQAGAGSDILKVYDAEIAGLQKQQKAIGTQSSPLQKLQDQLDALQRKAQELDLEKSLKFDPLTRQIDQAANGMKEMPFPQLLSQIKATRAQVDTLQVAFDKANAAVDAQQQVVNAAQNAHDKLQQSYDAEQRKLEDLRLAYQQYADQVTAANRAVSTALSDAKAKAAAKKRKKTAADELSPGAKNFLAAKGGNFPDVAGTGGSLGREFPNIKDQSGLIDQYTKDIAKQTADMFGAFDMFKPIRDGWKKVWGWVDQNVKPLVSKVWKSVQGAFSGGIGNAFQPLMDKAQPFIHTLTDIGQTIWKWLGHIWDLLGPEVKKAIDNIVKLFQSLWQNVGPQVVKVVQLIKPMGEAIGHLWNIAKPILGLLAVAFLGLVKVILSTLNGALGPAFEMIGKLIGNVLQVMINVVKLILDLINGDWKAAWHDAQQIVAGVFAAIGNILKGAVKIVWGIIKGFVQGIVNFFKWLWDMLVGHSIIPDMVKAIVDWFKRLPGMALDAIKSMGSRLGKWAFDSLNNAWNNFKNRWSAIVNWAKGIPQSMINTVNNLIRMLGTWAFNGLNNAWNNFKNRWSAIISWARGIPNSMYNTISSLISRLGGLGKSAFQSFYNSMTGMWNNSIRPWLGRIPGSAASALKGVGTAVANSVRSAVKGSFDWINKNVIGNVNKVTGAFGVRIPSLPSFARGGVIPGKETKKDSVLVAARPGEGVLVPEAVRGLGGANGIAMLNKMFMMGHPAAAFGRMQGDGLQHFALGGVVKSIGNVASTIAHKVNDWISQGAGFAMDHILAPVTGVVRSIMPNGFPEDFIASVIDRWRKGAKMWGDRTEGTLSMGPGGHSPQSISNIQGWLHSVLGLPYVWGAAGPKAFDCSGLVGAVYGFLRGLAGSGRGARFFTTTTIGPQPGLKPGLGPGLNIGVTAGTGHMAGNLAGLPFEATPPRVKIGSSAKPVIEFARKFHFDRGGMLMPGMGGTYNGTGKPEPVLTSAQWRAVMGAERAFGSLTTSALKADGVSILTAANARARAASARASETTTGGSYSGGLTVHIHGDLSFPNIDNKGSADTFLRNLETMARGS